MNTAMKTHLAVASVLAVGVLSVLAGCQLEPPVPPEGACTPSEFAADPAPIQPREQGLMQLPGYRLNFGDELEVIYQVRHDVTPGEYKLQIEDRIDIRFPFQANLDQSLQIPSDGNIHLLLIDEPIAAVGKTATELKKTLMEKYSKLIQNPQFTVVVQQANVKVEELKRTITTSPRGQSRLVPVAPDGRLALPYVPDVMAYGKTIPELISDLNRLYRQAGIEGIEVSVNVLNVAPIKVYVMGEVARPGLLNLRHHATLTQAIAAAGGQIRGRAELSKVLLVRRRGFKVPTGAVVNVHYLTDGLGNQAGEKQPIDFAAHRFDPFVQDDDIVFVPSTQLAKNADWIRIVFTEGIYRVIPWSSTANYTIADTADLIGPNP